MNDFLGRGFIILTKAPRGTKDILPQAVGEWTYIEEKIRKMCAAYGFGEIITPVFEHTELFVRGVGDTSDVVQKEMYTFDDKGGRSITLRPEGTAPIVRAFLENSLFALPLPLKLFYIISCYRYEKPQAGRLREFHQFGIEAIGSDEPSLDAEAISLASAIFKALGIKNLSLIINSIGCPSCRGKYNAALTEFLAGRAGSLCMTCNERLLKNPMRVFDCKSPECQAALLGAPRLSDYICADCAAHFDKVREYLDSLKISYEVDEKIVRGLDYYTKTVFEFVSDDIGAQGTVCGGGRYDGLSEQLGSKKPFPGVGFAMGLERLLLLLHEQGAHLPGASAPDIFIANIGQGAAALSLSNALRKFNIAAEMDHGGRSLKAQMKLADKLGARFSLVLGDNEVLSGVAALKDMKTGEAADFKLDDIAPLSAAILKGKKTD